ncbi:MAG TPA: HEAT repeat domain-containing protein [Verrucomicrobiae bacterium]|nr:HEAT repeat domain-containing protein [Verrucomicrobiae bacterium]
MRKRYRIALPVLLVAVVWTIAWQVLRLPEPVYQGKRLSAWLVQYCTNHWSDGHWSAARRGELDTQAENAIRQIGTNAIPTCLRIIATRDSPLFKVVPLLPERWVAPFYKSSLPEYQFQGAYGLIALGADAKPAVPALIALLNDSHGEVRYAAVFALDELGSLAEEALPSMVKCLKPDEFHSIRVEPERAIPVLVRLLDESQNQPHSERIRGNAMSGLRQFRALAKPAVPSLLRLLNDSNGDIRWQVTNALMDIDPEAAARVGVK